MGSEVFSAGEQELGSIFYSLGMAYQERTVCGTVLFTQLGRGPNEIL